MKKNNLVINLVGLVIGLLIGIFVFNPSQCGKDTTNIHISDSLYKIKRERDSSYMVINKLNSENDTLTKMIYITKSEIEQLEVSILSLKNNIADKEKTIGRLKGNLSGLSYRYLSDDSLIVALKLKFKNIK